jgi:ubiquinone/menaquinone biosynthesis C-methylase UbiE
MVKAIGAGPFERGLDIGCGTGLSTLALASHASLAVGVDSVEEMLRHAIPGPNAAYCSAAAEHLPLAAGTFEVVTVSSGVHWFDQRAFFAEAARVLVRRGWIGIYDHIFVGARDEPAIDVWLNDDYAQRYPSPPRFARAGTPLHAASRFREVAAFEYEDPITFTHDELVAYLLSHSNTIVPATAGRESEEETEAWLRSESARWFEPPEDRTFLFRGAVRCLRLED